MIWYQCKTINQHGVITQGSGKNAYTAQQNYAAASVGSEKELPEVERIVLDLDE